MAAASHRNVYDYVRNCLAIEQAGAADYIGSTCSTFGGGLDAVSPYRTHSHSGFQSPRRDTRPTHYHTGWATTQYVPLPRALSISELFASGRVLRCADAEVPLLLRCAIEQRPALSLGALPPLPREPREQREEEEEKEQQEQRRRQQQLHGECQMPRAEFLRRMCQLEEHFAANVSTCNNKSPETTRAVSEYDKEATPTVPKMTVTVDVHAGAEDPRMKSPAMETLSRQLVVEIIDHVLQMPDVALDDAVDDQAEANKENISVNDAVGATFLRKIDAMSYSTESPIVEYPPKAVQPLQELMAVKQRPLMMRHERLQRHEQFIELMHTAQPLPPPPASPDVVVDEPTAADHSLYDPMEQQILHRIDAYALDRVDPIFTKIRNTIIEYNTSRASERSLIASATHVGTPIKVPSSTPTFDVDAATDESTEGKLFGSTNVSTVLTSSPSEPPLQATFDRSMDEYFRPDRNGRNSSTPKAPSSGRSSMTTTAVANRGAATLNTRRSSARWAASSSSSRRANGSLSFGGTGGDATAVPVTLNVSKSRSAAKLAPPVDRVASPAVQPQQRKKPPRNFIQENIAKAAQRSKVRAIPSAGNSTATSSTVSLASKQPQQRRGARVVVPPSPPKTGTPVRSNPASIFALNPFHSGADTAAAINVDSVNECMQQQVADKDVSAVTTESHHSLETGTESELCLSSGNSHTNSAGSVPSDPQYEAEVAAIQQNIDRLLAAQDATAAAAVDAQLDGLGEETARLSACIAQCDERLAALRLDGVAAEMDEVEALHGVMAADRDGELAADCERLDDEWSRYHDLVHELEIEED